MPETTEVYNPAAVELPKIELLGETYQLAEVTKTRAKRLNKLQGELLSAVRDGQVWEKIEAGEEAEAPERTEEELEDVVLRIECDMIETAVAADGLSLKLQAAFDADEISMQFLTRASAWLQKRAQEANELGND